MKILRIFFLTIAISIFLLGCENGNNITKDNEDGSFGLRMQRDAIPEIVHSIEAQLSNEAETLTADFGMESDPVEAEFSNLQLGNWNLSVSAFDTGNNLVFFGETEVTINSGINYANVEMNPVGGNLIVNLSWNEQEVESDDYIFVWANQGSRNIFRYSVLEDDFVQITSGVNSAYPNYYAPSNSLFYRNRSSSTLYSIDYNGENVSSIGELTYQGIEASYSQSTNKFYYYFFDSYGKRSIGIENIDDNNIWIMPSGNYDNAVPKPNHDGSEIVYVSDRNVAGVWQVYKYNFETEEDLQLTSNEHDNCQPLWNNDFTGFYYKSMDTMSIYFYDLDSGESSLILNNIPGDAFYYRFDSLENKIALNIKIGNDFNLFIYDRTNESFDQISSNGEIWGMPIWIKE
jgi:hypothetical protein